MKSLRKTHTRTAIIRFERHLAAYFSALAHCSVVGQVTFHSMRISIRYSAGKTCDVRGSITNNHHFIRRSAGRTTSHCRELCSVFIGLAVDKVRFIRTNRTFAFENSVQLLLRNFNLRVRGDGVWEEFVFRMVGLFADCRLHRCHCSVRTR